VAAALGYAGDCNAWYPAGDSDRSADRVSRGPKHHAERAAGAAHSASHHRIVALDQFTDTIVGPGVLAGIIAIALRSIGFIGKLLYEAIEEIDVTQVEAIEATGASPAQVMDYGIVPQIMPAFAGISVFR